MSINLIDLFKDEVSDQLVKHAGAYLGESESSVTSALGGIVPALLGSMIQKSSTPSGAQGLMDLIGKLDIGSLSNVAGLLGGGQSSVNSLLDSGSGIVGMLLGAKSDSILDSIGKLSGLKNSNNTGALMKMAAPLLMGLIGKQIKGKGLNGLVDLLAGQKSFVKAALPSGLSSVLNFGDFSMPKANVNMPLGSGGNNSGMDWLKWALGALLALAVIYWLASKGCGSKVENAVQDAVDQTASTISETAQTATDAAGNAAGAVSNFFKKTLSSGFELLNANENGIESQLIAFIEDNSRPVDKETWFNFDRLLFDTGKSTLQPSSQEQLTNVAEILKAFPKVKLKIGGYTDNVGDPKANLKLSTDRAFNVMNELIAKGIDKSRLSAEGYGDKHPVASNDTEEGRQQNRRIAVRVTEK